MRKDIYVFNGFEATVLVPNNPNGEWIWKTEFFYAFDKLEQDLFDDGYTRVYYQISDKYGSPFSVELMHSFYLDLLSRYNLNKKCILIGYSRGGLYAFNFALKYPSCVKKMYLDSPVLDLRTWPKKEDSPELYNQVLTEYNFSSDEDLANYKYYPVYKLKDYFSLNIPTLLVCAKDDSLVCYDGNSRKMIDYALNNKVPNFFYYVKCGSSSEGGNHHPHSFGNIDMDLLYGCKSPNGFNVFSNLIPNSDINHLKKVPSVTSLISWFFYTNSHDFVSQINLENNESSYIKVKKDTYHIYPEDVTFLKGVFLSNTDTDINTKHGQKHVLIYIKDKDNLTIDCNGSNFILHGPLTSFLFKNCSNIKLMNATFDYKNPTMSEMYVEKKIDDKYIVEVNPACLFDIKDNSIIFHSEINRSGSYYWSYDYRDDNCICLFNDEETSQTKTRVFDKSKKHPCAPRFSKITSLGNNLIEVSLFNQNDYFKVGSTLEIRNTIRDEIGGAFVDCNDATMENVTFNSIHGFGILSQCCNNVKYLNNKIIPSRGRKISCNADFFHFSCCRGNILIQGNHLKEGHDDYINIHGIHTVVSKIKDSKTIEVEFKHPCSYGFNFYRTNDSIGLIDRNRLIQIDENKVIGSNLIDDYHIELRLEKDVDERYLGNGIDNISTSPKVEIKDNKFDSSMGRGILVTTREKCLIENNEFNNLAGAALCVCDDCNFWYESSLTNDVIFKDNKVTNCAYNPFGENKEFEIFIKPEVMDKSFNGYVHNKIEVKDNVFSSNEKSINMLVMYTKEFIIENNSSNKKIVISKDI